MRTKFYAVGYEDTPYGFNWGHVKVERAAQVRGNRVITIKTPRDVLQVRVTPTGLIRVDSHRSVEVAKVKEV